MSASSLFERLDGVIVSVHGVELSEDERALVARQFDGVDDSDIARSLQTWTRDHVLTLRCDRIMQKIGTLTNQLQGLEHLAGEHGAFPGVALPQSGSSDPFKGLIESLKAQIKMLKSQYATTFGQITNRFVEVTTPIDVGARHVYGPQSMNQMMQNMIRDAAPTMDSITEKNEIDTLIHIADFLDAENKTALLIQDHLEASAKGILHRRETEE